MFLDWKKRNNFSAFHLTKYTSATERNNFVLTTSGLTNDCEKLTESTIAIKSKKDKFSKSFLPILMVYIPGEKNFLKLYSLRWR